MARQKRLCAQILEFIFLIVLAVPAQAGIFSYFFGAPQCKGLSLQWQEQSQIPEATKKLANDLAEAGVPMMMKDIGGKSVPVILVNAKTVDNVKALFEKSIGVMTQLQPNHNNDHGMMRVGTKLMDIDTPGARGYGEINQTGISWKEIVANTKRQSPQSLTRIEVSFILTKTEMDISEFYHRVRRAAIFRVPFTFGNAVVDNSKPNALDSGGEHCFLFCRGSSVNSQVLAISTKIRSAGIQDVDSFMAQPRVLDFLKTAKDQIMSWEVNWGNEDAALFNNSAVGSMAIDGKSLLDTYSDIFPAGIEQSAKIELANWLIAREASTAYADMLSKVGVPSGSGYEGYGSKRASFFVIYDHRPDSAEHFKNATYSADAKFGNGKWTADSQRSYAKL